MASENRKTVLVAMGANLSLAVAKATVGVVSGSQAVLAEAAHSLSDTMNEVFLLVSLIRGQRKPDEQHPFGYGHERFFWAFMAAIFIFVAGASYAIYEGVSGLVNPHAHQIGSLGAAYAVLGFALVAEGTSFTRAYYQARTEAKPRRDLRGVIRHVRRSKDPTVKTVLFEDGAAITGLGIALVGLLLYQATGATQWDSVASILIGLLLATVAVTLGRDIQGLLLGSAALPEVRQRLWAVIAEFDEVDDVLELLTMHLGPDSLLVAVRMDLVDTLTGAEVEEVSERIEHALSEAEPMVAEVFLDATPHPRKARSRSRSS